ncbi:MAG: DUF1292 domain-containing protein [Eubacteriales bacterium]|jgi:hypothetical protein|nr:DUF1292 domain-containing protein [Lachnospiraceae bacterium]MDD5859413.1 DUF1292 domain-containing protein [Eubacteriales bacterium]MCH4063029.1 DUF1292 domain-containing protein [Lachnospiraceae bacterium]MCH4104336.1 DUF1292 domain-containing protein [Lachnospiraceae bacterium]MCI1309003.1 DUF1292 domain-containing protein [Lachnospiraceae bacterium]
METVKFKTDDGQELEFYIEEQTRLNGTNYLLVADSEEEEANAFILKDISKDTDEEAEYVFVEDENELDALLRVFEEMMDDTDILL